MNETTGMLAASMIAFISAAANILYWAVHRNGKGALRLLTAAIMIYFGMTTAILALEVPSSYSGHQMIRQWLPILYIIPMWDLIIDWRHKTKSKIFGREKS